MLNVVRNRFASRSTLQQCIASGKLSRVRPHNYRTISNSSRVASDKKDSEPGSSKQEDPLLIDVLKKEPEPIIRTSVPKDLPIAQSHPQKLPEAFSSSAQFLKSLPAPTSASQPSFLQRVVRWYLKLTLPSKLRAFKIIYDEDFNVSEFSEGAKQALRTVFDIIAESKKEGLEALKPMVSSEFLKAVSLAFDDVHLFQKTSGLKTVTEIEEIVSAEIVDLRMIIKGGPLTTGPQSDTIEKPNSEGNESHSKSEEQPSTSAFSSAKAKDQEAESVEVLVSIDTLEKSKVVNISSDFVLGQMRYHKQHYLRFQKQMAAQGRQDSQWILIDLN